MMTPHPNESMEQRLKQRPSYKGRLFIFGLRKACFSPVHFRR
jgi:hypothetical protein